MSLLVVLGGPEPAETRFEWVLLGDWQLTQQIAVGVLALAVLALTLWNLRRVKGWPMRGLLFLLRCALVALLGFVFLQPALLEETRALSTNTVLLLVDDSASMALPGPDGTRKDAVVRLLERGRAFLEKASASNTVEAYRFGGADLEGHDFRSIARQLTAEQPNTPIVETLESVIERSRHKDVGGIILISDGLDNGRAAVGFRRTGVIDTDTTRLLQSLGAPIHTFGFGGAGVADVEVREIRCAPFAFKRTAASLEAVIDVAGYDEGVLEVELLEDGKPVRSVTRTIDPTQRTYVAGFEFTPAEIGHRVYTVRVRALPGEVTVENNVRHTVVRVGRDKLRVLQIAGHPSWDERFLRNLLKSTPNVQLVSFFILVTASSARQLQQSETALIPFPAQELFVDELNSFDLVVFQDFNYGPFSTPEHLPRIAQFIRDGGGFLFLGGCLAFGAGGYEGTALDAVLPVDMTVSEKLGQPPLDLNTFEPRLTEAGGTHPITQLAFDPAENLDIWRSLPPLEGANLFDRARPGAITLVEHPTRAGADGQPMPVLVAGEAEKGRVVVAGTDSLWRWHFRGEDGKGDSDAYDTLMQNTLRWLVRDPALELVRVTPSAGVRALGQPVDLDIRVFEPDYTPAAQRALRVQIHQRARTPEELPTLMFDSSALSTDDAGRAVSTQTPDKPGIYDVRVTAQVGGREVEGDSVFVVADERPEMRAVLPSMKLLESIATATGGTSHTITPKTALDVPLARPRVSDVTSRRYHDRWNTPLVLALGCLLFTADWILRRRAGLL